MAAALPDAELATVPGAGHHLPLDTPEALTRLLVTFLDRAAQPARG
jgi:pimeloyl-ACP methyl ester carboxylesterase